ncbi:MAG: DsbA family protein [Candidatus Parcubacteria bacterium]|nr:DsbA family protein [Candidatus Parcubacteria bacterium]
MVNENQTEASRKWYNRWWGIFLLLIFSGALIFGGIFIYNYFYYYEEIQKGNYQEDTTKSISIETKDDPFIGAENPVITIVEFGDFECPYCRESVPILSKIIENYGTEVKIIFRDFPNLISHPSALKAALAANCANEQGRFWQYHDLLFEYQSDLADTLYNDLAVTLGLDMEKFTTCLDSQKYLVEVQDDLREGINLGVEGTPTYFINGSKLPSGVIPYETFVEMINKYKELRGL